MPYVCIKRGLFELQFHNIIITLCLLNFHFCYFKLAMFNEKAYVANFNVFLFVGVLNIYEMMENKEK